MNDTITNLIADIRKWEKNAKTNSAEPRLAEVGSALVSVLDPIATRLEQLIKDGFYVTPEAVRKFAEEQSKKDEGLSFEDAPNLNEVLRNPPFKGGAEEEERERFCRNLSVPALGIQFRRYRSANTTILVATWRDDFNSHVYVLRVERDGDSPNCGWRATATNDGHVVFQLRTKNRSNCEQFAFSAMKRYLKVGHRRTYRTIAKAKKEESNMNAETTKKLHALVRLCNEIIAEPDTAAKNAQIIKDELLALCESENGLEKEEK